jgi:L-fucose isomerase-like protein
MRTRPLVAVVFASHAREPSGFSLGLVSAAVELLRARNLEVLFSGNVLTSGEEVRRELCDLKKKEPDAYIACPGNWIEPPVLCHPLEEIRHENIILWGFPESLKLIREGHFLGSSSSFTVLRNAMRQMGFRFKAIQELPCDMSARAVYDHVRAARAARQLRGTRLGLIGYRSMGIYTACFDEHKIRAVFGTEIDSSADSYILCRKMEDVGKTDADEVEKALRARCTVDEKAVEDRSLGKSIRMYLALKRMAADARWEGLSVKCQHELSTYLKCTACLPLSLLTDEGLMCTDEGDIHALLSMVVMRLLSDGEALYFGDIYKLEEGGFLMAHCGLSPHGCAAPGGKVALRPQSARISMDGVTTGGIVSSYAFRKGTVTIGRLENDRDGSYLFHFVRGSVRPTDPIGAGYSSLVFNPEGSSDAFAEQQLANHYVFVYADIVDRLTEFCRLVGIRILS